MSRGNWLFVHFIDEHSEEVKATEMISQRLMEAAEGHDMLPDIVLSLTRV